MGFTFLIAAFFCTVAAVLATVIWANAHVVGNHKDASRAGWVAVASALGAVASGVAAWLHY